MGASEEDDEEDDFSAPEVHFVVPSSTDGDNKKDENKVEMKDENKVEKDRLQTLFDVMSDMVALHPDPEEDCDEESDFDEGDMAAGGWVFADDFKNGEAEDAMEDLEEEEAQPMEE